MKADEKNNLILKNVSVVYRNGSAGLTDASFQIPSASISGLVGINGAGKSTLFKAIMGLVPMSNGNISICGLSVKAALKQNLIAYVPQSEEVDWSFPILVEDVVMMGRYGRMNWLRVPKAEDHAAVKMALERAGMRDLRERQIGELSGGQRKRVFLARAIAQESKVILLDEPFSGVDVETENSIIRLLNELKNEGSLIVIATHNLGSVPEFCDHSIFLRETVLAFGPTKKVFTRQNLEKAFGGALRHFVLGGSELHSDKDDRKVTVISDDERPFVIYSEEEK